MKEEGFEHWNSPNTGATNESGFTGLPGGHRSNYNGNYNGMGGSGYFWSSTESSSINAWGRRLSYGHSVLGRNYYGKGIGFSVRCLRDVDYENVSLQNGFEVRSSEIISLTPSSGVQGENNIEITLVAGGVNFYDPYGSIEEIYFSGEGLSTSNYQVISETTVNFELDISSGSPSGSRDVYLNSQTYELTKIDAFTVEEGIYTTIEVHYSEGWNLTSFAIAIEDNAPEDVFADFLESGNLIYVTGFGEIGSMYYDPTGPPLFNTLTAIEAGLGYWIKVNESDDITKEGMPLTLNTSIDLMQDWTLIGYWPSENMSPEEAFAELISTGNLQYATGFDEGFTYYDPSGPDFANTLTALENGYGYWLRLNEAVEDFQYPEPSGAVAKQLALNPNPDIVKTNSAMFVNGTVFFQDIDVEEGTRVNIYTESGLLVGEMDIVNNNYLSTGAVYGDDMTTEAVDGALQNEALVFIYNDYASDPVSISFTGNMELAKVDLVFRNTPETFTLHQNFPNPFNPITTLRYDLPSDALVTLTVFDMLGKEITQLVNTIQQAGFKSVQWDATDSLGRPVSAGVYLYQIQAGDFIQTKKMVLLK